MFFEKNACLPPPRVPLCALLKEGKERNMTVLKRKRLLRLKEHAHIYIYMNINKGYHPMKFDGFHSSGHCDLDL